MGMNKEMNDKQTTEHDLSASDDLSSSNHDRSDSHEESKMYTTPSQFIRKATGWTSSTKLNIQKRKE